ncbi:MAG: PKD domain-containing protein [Candidatus Cloacimonas sp.]|nr:PKD domain-containing protein [Candidatus Cloacimonas sp.]
MKTKITFTFVAILLLFLFTACDKDDNNKPPVNTEITVALNNYWQYQTDLTSLMEAHDGTMDEMQNAILNLGSKKKSRDAFTQIDAMVEDYVSQSNAIAGKFDVLVQAENAIVPYGGSKNLLTDIAKGVYNKAKDTVVSGGKMVRSGWRVLSGKQSMRQVLNDPDSGIPLISGWAATIQKRNSARDAEIRNMIENWNPVTSPADCNNTIPYDDLPGSTPQEKANAYLNMSDEDPVKMGMRRDVMLWSDDERQATAETAKKLGETGVKAVGDAYGGPYGEWTNEIVNQMLDEDETADDCGTMDIDIPVTASKTLIISKANMPDDDPRITVIMNAPQNLEQQLPPGEYHIIALAEGFIRGVYENLQIVKTSVTNLTAELLNLAENPIIIEDLTVQEGCITVNQPVHSHLSCVSTIGQELSFTWTVSGGSYTGFNPIGTELTFTPTEEKEYTISVDVSDNLNNHKTRSVSLASLGGMLAIDDWEIGSEDFQDNKLNPGEDITIELFVTNTGTTDLSGYHNIPSGNGFTSLFNSSAVNISAGTTIAIYVPLKINSEMSMEEITLQYQFTTENQNHNTVLISDSVELPVDFYVTIDEISDVVTDRIVNITGKIANPSLTTALLILDNDSEHSIEMNLNNGNFSQAVVLNGSTAEVSHTVYVIAVSGGLTAEDTMTFTSLVPLVSLHCTLTWDTSGTDVDFWITDPNKEKCYYAHRQTASGLALDVDDTNGYGPENITSASVIPGNYTVQVHYYSDHDYENAIGTNCVVVVRQAELTPVNYYGYLADTGDLWTVTTLHYDSKKGWSIKPNNAYSKVNLATLPKK